MQIEGGRLYGIQKTGQQEYGVAFVLNGEKPSVDNSMRTFLASKLSRAFHASPSDKCPTTPSFSYTPYLYHLMCLAVHSKMNNRFNQNLIGK
jgi:hypothetical protein